MRTTFLHPSFVGPLVAAAGLAAPAPAQEPAGWADPLLFHTFSIVAVDPETGESGAAVTTRNACVGNGVPWVRAGVGAVATQASTRTAYGDELLDLLEGGVVPREALARRLADDPRAPWRQVAVIGLDGRSAQHTGDSTHALAGHRAGPWYAVQGNTLVGPGVVDAVARTFEASQGEPRHLADRLVEALEAGQAAGGDLRRGRMQSAAVIVADPREGMARRADGLTVQINVCQHPAPVAELRRVHDAVSQTLGHRVLQRERGADVVQLKIALHALGYFPADGDAWDPDQPGAEEYGPEAVRAVDRFRADEGLSTPEDGSPAGLVDAETVERLWARVRGEGLEEQVRLRILERTRIRR